MALVTRYSTRNCPCTECILLLLRRTLLARQLHVALHRDASGKAVAVVVHTYHRSEAKLKEMIQAVMNPNPSMDPSLVKSCWSSSPES